MPRTRRAPKRNVAKRAAPHQHATEDRTAPPTLVSMRELSNYLNVSRNTLRKLVASGQVPHLRVGNQYRFDVVAVRNALSRFV